MMLTSWNMAGVMVSTQDRNADVGSVPSLDNIFPNLHYALDTGAVTISYISSCGYACDSSESHRPACVGKVVTSLAFHWP